MKPYYLQRRRGTRWSNLEYGPNQPVSSHMIHYLRGFQDAMQREHSAWTTRIVWMKGDTPVTVRICGNWTPAEPEKHEDNGVLERTGAAIRKQRVALGMTLRDVHDATGISLAFISDVENGKRRMSYDRLMKVAEALETTIRELCDDF